MAIKVASTTVINDSRVLQNLAGASGKYTDFHPTVTSISTVINFAKPVMTSTMSSNVTFSESNKGVGRHSILLLDTNTAGYTPTFSGNVEWANDTTPTWSDHRYWHISMWCWDATYVRAVAAGYNT